MQDTFENFSVVIYFDTRFFLCYQGEKKSKKKEISDHQNLGFVNNSSLFRKSNMFEFTCTKN